MDIVGTGGDGKGTLNISTAAAFVVAGAGVPVAKHGNRNLSSKSGAADALTEMGLNVMVGPDVVERCLAEAGIGFMMAPMHHPATRHVGPVRMELGTRTIFNILGPLTNPAGVKRQLTGAFAARLIRPMAEVLAALGSEAPGSCMARTARMRSRSRAKRRRRWKAGACATSPCTPKMRACPSPVRGDHGRHPGRERRRPARPAGWRGRGLPRRGAAERGGGAGGGGRGPDLRQWRRPRAQQHRQRRRQGQGRGPCAPDPTRLTDAPPLSFGPPRR
jgi:hypothetical protein